MRSRRKESYITIKDVAKKAGVSIATVSRVMNNGPVSDKKIKIVLETIKELNYEPNNSARNLASVSSTKRITLLLPSLFEESYVEFYEGFKAGCSLYKYEAFLEVFNYDNDTYKSLMKKYERSSEVRGIVQFGPTMGSEFKLILNAYSNNLIKIVTSDNLNNKNIGIYMPHDKDLSNFLIKNAFKNASEVTTNTSNIDIYIAHNVEDASKLISEGVKKEIYVLHNSTNLSKLLPQIKTLKMDSFAWGTALSRIMIKMLTNNEDEENNIVLKIGE